MYHYGMPGARIDRLDSFRKGKVNRKINMITDLASGVFLFYAPYSYLERVEKVWADQIISLDGWQTLIASLLSEWTDTNLLVSW
jgi:hypothetical protein